VDVAVLDMNHGWPNLGHDALIGSVRAAARDLSPHLARHGLGIRTISFEVRRDRRLPEGPNGRYGLYLGTGGPGHLDPRRNDGSPDGAQGVREDPAWEAPAFELFEAIRSHPDAALVAVCHTFGEMCRWLGIAEPAIRGPEKGGKSAGIVENVLTAEAAAHPWFSRLARRAPEGRLRILDSRLYDLIPVPGAFQRGVIPIGYETLGIGGAQGDAVTMIEVARDPVGVMPRIFASNHHPEVVHPARLLAILERKRRAGEVSSEWYAERRRTLEESLPDERTERRLRLTSEFTLLGPMRFHIRRQVRRRIELLGHDPGFHEDDLPASD
jgi:hypothetical protein